jgi:serine/threonine-protein kinase
MQQPLQPGQLLGGYALWRVIGQGEQSTVYLAEHTQTRQVVALKAVVLPTGEGQAAAAAAFILSAQVAAQLVHPGIVHVLQAGTDAGVAWLAMEAVPGSQLARYTQPARLLPEALVLQVATPIAQALAYSHEQGVVHRDLKPANVLVDLPTHTVKLADFGLAHFNGAARTGTGVVLGTPAYQAPEQLAGNPATAAGDLYALGVMLYQLLAGALPHESHSMGELLRRVAQRAAPDLRARVPGIRPALADMVSRLLERKPAARPASAAAVAAELAALATMAQTR